MLEGDVNTAKARLRDLNATIGFEALGNATGMPPFRPKGNPTTVSLFNVIGALQANTGVHLKMRAVAA